MKKSQSNPSLVNLDTYKYEWLEEIILKQEMHLRDIRELQVRLAFFILFAIGAGLFCYLWF